MDTDGIVLLLSALLVLLQHLLLIKSVAPGLIYFMLAKHSAKILIS